MKMAAILLHAALKPWKTSSFVHEASYCRWTQAETIRLRWVLFFCYLKKPFNIHLNDYILSHRCAF